MTDLPDIAEGLVVHPGDTLLVRVRPSCDIERLVTVRDALRDSLPGITVLVVSCEQVAVVRGGEQRAENAKPLCRDLNPGDKVEWADHPPLTIEARKGDGSGWWLSDGSGIADFAFDSNPKWQAVQP